MVVASTQILWWWFSQHFQKICCWASHGPCFKMGHAIVLVRRHLEVDFARKRNDVKVMCISSFSKIGMSLSSTSYTKRDQLENYTVDEEKRCETLSQSMFFFVFACFEVVQRRIPFPFHLEIGSGQSGSTNQSLNLSENFLRSGMG